MLKLADFDNILLPIDKLYREFADSVIADIAKRLIDLNSVATAAWQVRRLIDSGLLYYQILERIEPLTGMLDSELEQIFEAFGIKAVEHDNKILQQAGVLPQPFNLSEAMLQLLEASARRTAGLLKNLTLTTANTGQDAYFEAVDLAYMQVTHGAMSYGQAIKEAITKVANDGLKVIQFPSGRKDQIDVAVRRAVLTGASQAAGDVQIANLKELGVDLIAVSAHIGARDQGGLPENHELWQGRVYTLGGNPQYPNFFEWTGYGTGPGLGGWNCRHSFYPFYEGLSQEFYTQEILEDYADREVQYNGKTYSYYEATQIQRKIERQIRAKKREAAALAEVGEDNLQELAEVRQLQARMRDFIKQTGLGRQYTREGGGVQRVEKSPEPMPRSPLPGMQVPAEEDVENPLQKMVGVFGTTPNEDPNRKKGYYQSNKVLLANGQSAIQKPNEPELGRNEAAAYDLDQFLEINLVPETIFYEKDGSSYQLFVEDTTMGIMAQPGDLKHPEEVGLLRFLDVITGNVDRHNENFLITKDGHLVAIDNGYAWLESCSPNRLKDWLDSYVLSRTEWQTRLLSKSIQQKYNLNSMATTFWQHMGSFPVPIPAGWKTKLERLLDKKELEIWMETRISSGKAPYWDQKTVERTIARAEFMLKFWDHFFIEV